MTAVTLLLASALVLGERVRREGLPSGRSLLGPVAVGLLDSTANGLYAWGTTTGLLSVVAVLGSLYPVTVVLLARLVLRERVRRSQELGIVAALAGVVMIAGG
jgi:drug/metabolite transporter (DMT)-like permease